MLMRKGKEKEKEMGSQIMKGGKSDETTEYVVRTRWVLPIASGDKARQYSTVCGEMNYGTPVLYCNAYGYAQKRKAAKTQYHISL
jgi:hypothetical protein